MKIEYKFLIEELLGEKDVCILESNIRDVSRTYQVVCTTILSNPSFQEFEGAVLSFACGFCR